MVGRPLKREHSTARVLACCGQTAHCIEGERVVLRSADKADRAAFAATIDDTVCRWQGWPVGTNPYEAFARRIHRQPTRHLYLLVTDRGSGEVVGVISAEIVDGHVVLGWWLGSNGRGRRLSAEALRLAVTFWSEHLEPVSIRAGTSLLNEAARRQMESAGGRELLRKSHRLPDGSSVEGVEYSWP